MKYGLCYDERIVSRMIFLLDLIQQVFFYVVKLKKDRSTRSVNNQIDYLSHLDHIGPVFTTGLSSKTFRNINIRHILTKMELQKLDLLW